MEGALQLDRKVSIATHVILEKVDLIPFLGSSSVC